MKKTLIALLALAMPAFQATAESDTGTVRHVVLQNTELRELHSNVTGRDYLIYIGYPDSYASHPERSYPVVYLTDAYWSFAKHYSAGSSLWYDQVVPEYILVGIGYVGENVDYGTERLYELSPSVPTHGFGVGARTAGARAFLDSIKTEIIPMIEGSVRADPSFRVISGTSLGGLFSLFAMYEEPGLFQGVIASSPAVMWDDCWMFRRSSELRNIAIGPDSAGTYSVPTRLFMCVGDSEWPSFTGTILAYDQILKSAGYADFEYQFRVLEGERHGGAAAEGFQRGIRFVFEPMMPSPVMP